MTCQRCGNEITYPALCKPCSWLVMTRLEADTPEHHRHSRRVAKYGITRKEFARLYVMQGGACAICQSYMEDPTAVNVDHDHETGEVRGLLCRSCNVALGWFGDDEAGLRRALEYLTDPPARRAASLPGEGIPHERIQRMLDSA